MKAVVVGGGMVGLCASMLLAKDGHEVVVLERDPAPAPEPGESWSSWERRGVNQFRLAHFFLARFRTIIEAELPELASALDAAGATRYNIVANIPDEMKGGSRPGDDRFDTITGRRTVMEAVTAKVAEATPGVTVRRGSAVQRLLTGPPTTAGVPHIVGVELEGGESIEGDVVIDAGGRRSPQPRWLTDAGAQPPAEELEDCGFVYYGRHFRSEDGSLPVMLGPLKQDYGSISVLTLPADNGCWSVTLTASAKDSALRALTDPEKWRSAVRTLPLAAHWIDAEPIDDGVSVMAKIEDRIRDFAPHGEPVATGILAVGDAWSCTNPSLGRGVSIGAMHAVLLRDILREHKDGDPAELAAAWYEATRSEMEPWYRTTLNYDRHRLAEVQAIIDDRPFESDDPEWTALHTIEGHGAEDPEVLRAFIDTANVLRRTDEIIGDPAVAALVDRYSRNPDDLPSLGPTRPELLQAIS